MSGPWGMNTDVAWVVDTLSFCACNSNTLDLALSQRAVDQSPQLLADERTRSLLGLVEQLRVTVDEPLGVVAKLCLQALDDLGLHGLYPARRLDLGLNPRLQSKGPLEQGAIAQLAGRLLRGPLWRWRTGLPCLGDAAALLAQDLGVVGELVLEG